MKKLDKMLCSYLWIVVIIIMFGMWFLIDDPMRSKKLIGITAIIAFLLIWALLALSNPKNVRGIIYWRSGEIQKTGYFDRYSDFEEWKEAYLRENGHNIKLIDYEFQELENKHGRREDEPTQVYNR